MTKTFRRQKIAVWFDEESRQMRRKSRMLERRYRKSGLAEDRLQWVRHERERHRLNRLKENAYWLLCVSDHSSHPRKLWKTFSTLMGIDRAKSIPVGIPTAQNLLNYFTKKIRRETGGPLVFSELAPPGLTFDSFRSYDVDEVRKIIATTASKSSCLDPIPTYILKQFISELTPYITEMCNRSLRDGWLPVSQQHAIITPIIKKEGLSAEDLKSYRPISNLTYISKLVERLVSLQLTSFLEQHGLLPSSQSGFRKRHSTETATLKVISDILTAADQKKVTLLGLLDMSAAFDTVDHSIMLRRLETSFGITGAVLSWLKSFLQDRTQQVLLGESSSLIPTVTSGVLQGSVLGLLLFLLYTAEIPEIASKHHLNIHFYADDGQLYFYAEPHSVSSLVDAVSYCIDEIDKWMSSNRLKLNADKTQFIWLGSSFNLGKVDIQSVNLGAGTVLVQSNVNDLGVLIDSTLSMTDHVHRVCRTSFYQLRQIRAIRKSLTRAASEALVHAFISSRLDYCNSLLYGINQSLLDKLQAVLRAAAWLVMKKLKFDHISDDIRDELHWLPVKQRISFKICMYVRRCLDHEAPAYLSDMLTSVSDVDALRRHRSADRADLVVPRTKTVRYGDRSFAVSGPRLWNALPAELKTPNISLLDFKRGLKTMLFKQAFA